MLHFANSLKLTGLALAALPLFSHAELKPMNDDALSEVVGQAFIQINEYQHPEQPNVDYIRTDLGMDVEVQLNADVLELGRYPRWDEKRGDWETQPADILIEDFSLGHIYEESFYATNPLFPKPVKEDGTAYQDGEVVPFKITDPYIEFVMDNEGGTPTPVGLRVGYGKAEGSMSGKILSLTGDVQTTVRTNLNYVANQTGSCDLEPELCQRLGLEPLLGEVELRNEAHLVYGEETAPEHLVGEIDRARAMHTGIKNGDSLDANVGPVSAGVTAQNCMAAAADVCFPLTQYQSLWVGNRDENGNLAGPADGMFLSFQTRPMLWNRDFKKGNTPEMYMEAVEGAYLSVPAGVMEIDTLSATLGTNRVKTEYINRGGSLF